MIISRRLTSVAYAGIDRDADEDPLLTFEVTADAGGCEHWRRVPGEAVVEVGAAWDVGGTESDDTLWAIRRSFAEGSSVTIALGAVAHGSATFEPDNLVVIFGEQEARAYEPPASRTDALGIAIAPGLP